MEDDKTKDEEEQPSTSKKESRGDDSVDDMYVDSHDDNIANSEISMQSSGSYSVISKLDMAGPTLKLPKLLIPKTDVKSHQKRRRVKTKKITGRVEKKKRPLTKRQIIRKALKRKPKSKEEKKERDLSMSTIFTRLSSNSQTPGCEYCGHRCCRRRFEYELRRLYQVYEKKFRRKTISRHKKQKKKYNSVMITECNQTGSCSNMFSPLFITTNSSPTNEPFLTTALHSEISPEMIHETLRMLSMWKQDVQTSFILDYLIRNYPVNNDKEALVRELEDKLRIAAILGMVCRTPQDTWKLSHEFQKRRVSRNHVTLFWKMYGDTLRPVAAKQVQKKQPGEDKQTTTRQRVITIHDEDIL